MIDFAFLDSGTGGIPYMLALKEKLPLAKVVYLGDTIHFPYGQKTASEVTECALSAISLILKVFSPRAIVIACNTISVTSLDEARKVFPNTPIVGTVPAIKLAAKVTKNKRIGLLATNATIEHPYCEHLIKDFAQGCVVVRRGDPNLVSFIENDFFTASYEQKARALKPCINFFTKENCDTIVLGCTHFTHIADVLQKEVGSGIKVVDSREGVANQAIRIEHKSKVIKDSAQNILTPNDFVLSISDKSFFVTAATRAQTDEYKTLCKKVNIPWGGVLHI